MHSRILVPIDGSAAAEAGLREAIALAATLRAALVALHVTRESALMAGPLGVAYYGDLLQELESAGEALVRDAARHAAEAGVACETAVVDGNLRAAWEVIVEQTAATRCDLIVMGTHGRRGLHRLTLGSDAELVLRHAPVPVLLVRVPA